MPDIESRVSKIEHDLQRVAYFIKDQAEQAIRRNEHIGQLLQALAFAVEPTAESDNPKRFFT